VTRNVDFLRQAQADVRGAVAWLEEQQYGLGERFADAVRSQAQSLSEFPSRYPIVKSDVRQARVRGFSYALYYRVRSDVIVIVAVLHVRRAPAVLENRL